MKNQAISLFPLMLLLLQLSSCGERLLNEMKITSEDQRAEIVYSTLVPSEDTNKSITLSLDPLEENKLTIGSEINLEITNQSQKNTIWFPLGLGIKIFQWNDGTATWQEIKNKTEYFGEGEIRSPRGGVYPYTSYIDVVPILENKGENIKLRISVFGYIYQDGQPTDQKVSAYLDVELTP